MALPLHMLPPPGLLQELWPSVERRAETGFIPATLFCLGDLADLLKPLLLLLDLFFTQQVDVSFCLWGS